MKSSRTFFQNQKEKCNDHKYCIHQHFQKCKKQRHKQINYTIFPNDHINTYNNAHLKSTNQYSYNFQTLAYQNFAKGKQPETQDQRNFVKNYYLENVPQKISMTNQIVKQLENQVFPFNAYNLAEGASKDYYSFQMKRQQYLITARRRAKNNSNQFGKNLKILKIQEIQQRSKWINKIIATIQDLGRRIFGLVNSNKQNESANGKQRIFLNQKQHINQKYLKEYNIKDVQASKNIFQDLRAQMLRKKKKFEDLRIQNKNLSIEGSFISQTNASQSQLSGTSQSMISAASQAEREDTQGQMIKNLCDFDQLKKKWKTLDVQKIKDIILSSLTRKIILNCESEKAKKISTYQRQCKSIPSKLKQNDKDQNKGNKRSQTHKKDHKKQQIQYKAINKQNLSKQEAQIKQNWLKASNLESMGSKYEKIKNLSNLFKKKQKNLNLSLSLKMDQGQLTDKLVDKRLNKVNFFNQNKHILEDNNRNSYERMQKGYKTTRATLSYLRN